MAKSEIDVALTLIKPFEGLELKSYPDPGTGGDPWTIGYGATGPEIKPGLVWTKEQADARLASDVTKFALGVCKLVKVPVNANQSGALISFAFNVGLGALGSSTLLKKLNAGDYAGAAQEFARWNKAGGKVMPGLTRRRSAEALTFRTPV